ncbi:fimbrial protein [Escherichia marmotae]|uniref:fimbrial protein n=1 Tax=Escherichia marmotae TaxID=1499973 RepID=UPI002F318C93
MKKKMTALFIASALFSGTAMAGADDLATNDSSSATLNFEGRVTSNACQVATDNLEQTINLGEVTLNQIENNDGSNPQSFTVSLVNCDTNTSGIFYTLNDSNGSEGNQEYLIPTSTDTSAKGVAVYVQKSDGTTVTTGEEVELSDLGVSGSDTVSTQNIALRAMIKKTPALATDVTPGTVNAKGTLVIRTTVTNPNL